MRYEKYTYEWNFTQLPDSEQFERHDIMNNSVVQKNEKKNLNKELLAMNKKDEITEGLFASLKSTGSQPARLYGLAKKLKKYNPLRPVLSLTGSSYEKLKKQ